MAKKKSKIVLHDANDESKRIEIEFKDGILTYSSITEEKSVLQILNTNNNG